MYSMLSTSHLFYLIFIYLFTAGILDMKLGDMVGLGLMEEHYASGFERPMASDSNSVIID